MRATALPLAALAAALLLTSCGDGGDGDGGADEKPGGGATAACAIGDLEVQVGPANAAPAAGDTGNVPVTLTNNDADCTLEGLPSLTLTAGDTSAEVAPDAAATGEKRTLAKGGTVSVIVTYVRGGGDGSLAAKTAEFKLPGADTAHSFPWSYGDVALKGEQPDATVSGFQQGD
ncbi:putative secreted protein [Streptomyces davaonensis JCM 4913]|uniref:Putative secreted protein n=1 Tax=Streptomyces davaonensis (strain DSM 101723 / JCM 4913 / KCC S-0913 / 768) TaxID=1214101 RepID=K4R5X3_STRDJ|nr:DUF4232 domain-containing protein [Streptomyces davaonensis]CCK28465.1 putative secreted protein [Streptomyces davaonensis JCM 4913]